MSDVVGWLSNVKCRLICVECHMLSMSDVELTSHTLFWHILTTAILTFCYIWLQWDWNQDISRVSPENTHGSLQIQVTKLLIFSIAKVKKTGNFEAWKPSYDWSGAARNRTKFKTLSSFKHFVKVSFSILYTMRSKHVSYEHF